MENNVVVMIEAPLLYTDESIALLSIGNSYIIEKTKIEDFYNYERIIDGRNQLDFNYLGSRICSNNCNDNGLMRPTVSLMRIHKTTSFEFNSITIEKGKSYNDTQLDAHEQLEMYQDKEYRYLNAILTLLQIFSKGNIGLKEVFFEFKYTILGMMNFTKNSSFNIQDANIIREKSYVLSQTELNDCNAFISRHMGIESNGKIRINQDGSYLLSPEFNMMRPIIEEFVFGLKQIDIPTSFEQFTTALEMISLFTNEQGKKQALSKRIAVLIATNNRDITSTYRKMRNFYRYRSESLHEGDGSNITVNGP